MSEELKPCPFCGGTDIRFDIETMQPDNIHGGTWSCGDCDSVGPNTAYWHASEEEAKLDAANAWNTRHIPEGYALVPVEPTAEMIDAGFRADSESFPLKHIYKAMIAAAQEEAK